MRLLFVLNEVPYPAHRNGVALINYQLLAGAPVGVCIDLLVADEPNADAEIKFRELAPAVNKITYVGAKYSRWLQMANLLVGAIWGRNFFERRAVRAFLDTARERYDLIYAAPLMTYFRLSCSVPVFLNAVDSVSRLNLTAYRTNGRFFDLLKQKIYARYEKNILPTVAKASFVSDVDVNFVRTLGSIDNVVCLPNGVDVNSFSPGISLREPNSILFTGNFGYQPNAAAAILLSTEIFPKLRAVVPDLKLYIVGPRPPNEVLNIPGVTATGFVDDIREYYQRCTAFVSPLRSGAGVKNKILEAMASGIPIVASSLSIDGIVGMENGVHYIRADSTDEFCSNIEELLKSSSVRDALSIAAISLVTERMQWCSVVNNYYNEFAKTADLALSDVVKP